MSGTGVSGTGVTGTPGGRRRYPRYGVFIATGAVLGVVAAVVLTFVRPAGQYSYSAVLGYLAVALGAAGAVLGGLVAVIIGIVLDRHR